MYNEMLFKDILWLFLLQVIKSRNGGRHDPSQSCKRHSDGYPEPIYIIGLNSSPTRPTTNFVV